MTGYDIVKELREMEQKATPGPWGYGVDCDGKYVSSDLDILAPNNLDTVCTFQNYEEYKEDMSNAEAIITLRNNADLLLSIAEAFQPGDVKSLNQVASYIELYVIERQDQENKRKRWIELAATVRRLQAAAERLECGESKTID